MRKRTRFDLIWMFIAHGPSGRQKKSCILLYFIAMIRSSVLHVLILFHRSSKFLRVGLGWLLVALKQGAIAVLEFHSCFALSVFPSKNFLKILMVIVWQWQYYKKEMRTQSSNVNEI